MGMLLSSEICNRHKGQKSSEELFPCQTNDFFINKV